MRRKAETFFISCIVISMLSCLPGYSQGTGSGHVLLKGKIKQSRTPALRIWIAGIFSMGEYTDSILVHPDGTFGKWVPIPASGDLLLIVREEPGLQLFARLGDTVSLEWDDQDFQGTVRSTGARDTLNALYCENLRKFGVERDTLYERRDTCTEMFSAATLVRAHNKKEFEWLRLAAIGDSIYNKIAWELFFRNLSFICNSPPFIKRGMEKGVAMYGFPFIGMYDKLFHVELLKGFPKAREESPGVDSALLWRVKERQLMNERMVRFTTVMPHLIASSYQYRSFYHGYMQELTNEIFNQRMGKDFYQNVPNYAALINAMFEDETMKDWLIADYINNLLKFNTDWNTEKNFEEAIRILKNPLYKERLTLVRKGLPKLVVGQKAPPFRLKTEKGELITLEQLKGKYVYLNFWSSGCAPCIADLKSVGEEIGKIYKNHAQIVVLHISLDGDEKDWKKSVAQYSPWGNNYWAEGGMLNPITSLYGISAVPRHMLINPDGTMRKVKAGELGELLMENILE